jgi:hypothetical protein
VDIFYSTSFYKTGTDIIKGGTTGGNDETYTFKASDGSIAYLLHPPETTTSGLNPSNWVLVTYPRYAEKVLFFNKTAAEAVLEQIKLHLG